MSIKWNGVCCESYEIESLKRIEVCGLEGFGNFGVESENYQFYYNLKLALVLYVVARKF